VSVDWKAVAKVTAHRPWPAPERAWVMTMSWVDLLFAHWRVDAEVLRAKLPPGLELDTFEGEAWIAVVPFRMEHVGPRGASDLPWVSRFAELNVRTYVRRDDKPGVWFLSLDAANPLAVRAARLGFHLPYYDADMRCEWVEDWIAYESRRTDSTLGPGEFVGRYQPEGEPYAAAPGTLEHWLTERYCLYAADGDRLWRGEIQHAPWPLQRARAEIKTCTVTDAYGIELSTTPELLHFAHAIDVVAWMPDALT
jgi:hypothetical protein